MERCIFFIRIKRKQRQDGENVECLVEGIPRNPGLGRWRCLCKCQVYTVLLSPQPQTGSRREKYMTAKAKLQPWLEKQI